ncbi:MAG: tRNA lysidine(34) synthetase TilS [Ruminococcus sp.]|nr:tRNA lysidine(34) synthetase TilS [Ruminococcus sp.]
MLKKIRNTAEKYNMFKKGITVVCGLSGGADSVCLLLALQELSDSIGFSVEAIHVNHCLRGAESDRDQKFCADLCGKLGISFTAVSCNVREYSEKHGVSCEEAARILRYGIFKDYTVKKLLATAHNADDNLETMLLNIIRGTGLKGIAGIPPVRDNIIRPLIAVSRREIEEYLSFHGQDYVTDSTNLTDDFTRNKIRHKIIPLMKEINGSLTETTVRSAEVLRSENSFIEENTSDALKNCLKNGVFIGLSGYNEVIRRRCIARYLSEHSLPFSHKRLTECDNIAVNGGKINISGDIYLISDGTSMKLEKILPQKQELLSAELKIGENRIFPDSALICELIDCESLKKNDFVHKNLTFYLLDYDKIKGTAIVRNRKSGDKLKLRGKNFTSSVKKIINETIPASQRKTLHFIEDGEGTVFGEKIGIADRVAPDDSTSRLLKITILQEG